MARHHPAEIVTGAAVLLVAAGFLAYAVANTGRSGAPGYPLHAAFDHIDGLSLGSDVRLAGVKIGRVTRTSVDPKTYLANVTFTVQDRIKLPIDSSATITSDGLLGGKYLSIGPGGADKLLQPQDTLTITQGSVSFEQLIGKFIFNSGNSGKSGSPQQPPAGAPADAGKTSGSPGAIAPLQ